ncbi:uroporphyrinogen-III C-methyltransferase [Methanocella sp. CWC-04]|uniref:uroporphyrinogen-III C-methyltransferase n=1 Tax=Methanooceanicella nereidis TaxID=2052831 RepID=A0AAP2RFR0_9EURY|nr:uroporphyrinogen-III C-methyltransferase [Methanocella sp. CWC-04]MCD1296257.1 uroporphyrinogen-III C-methyltransferase [Methanocella sp. CWC-04]
MNSVTKTGKVYLIGAGPGDPELLTRKAERILKEADIILYDALVSEGIKELFNKKAKLIDVGKRADNHTYPQAEINQMLVDFAIDGYNVARIKGGDPYVFGRGGEEAEELLKNSISVEVVPGISSAIAAPAYAGIPVTHREYSSSLTVITGHEDPTKGESALNFKALAKMQGTIVILMGIKRLKDNVDALISGGKSPDTPVAIIEKGTMPDQRLTTGTLGSIVSIAAERKIEAPAVIVIGDVVRLSGVLGKK